jgi:hypothetical protein
LSDDGDAVDVLVVTPLSLNFGSVIQCRPIGMLQMEDESGLDAKVLAVPIDKLTGMYSKVSSFRDMPDTLLNTIAHFFEHYKDLEPGKWVKINEGIDVCNLYFTPDAGKERRYIIVRKKIKKYPNSGGKLLFEEPRYRYSAYVTNIELPVDQIYNIYPTFPVTHNEEGTVTPSRR